MPHLTKTEMKRKDFTKGMAIEKIRELQKLIVTLKKNAEQIDIRRIQAENNFELLKDTQGNTLDEQKRKYEIKIHNLEKELYQYKNAGNNPQLIKNLQSMINKLQTANLELKEQLEKLKQEPTEDRFDMLRTQAKEITKLQDELTELRKTLHSERDKFFTLCNQNNEEIKMLKNANCDAEQMKKLRDENTQYRMEIDKLKDDLHLSKASHKRLNEKEQQRDKLITALYDLQ